MGWVFAACALAAVAFVAGYIAGHREGYEDRHPTRRWRRPF